MLLGVQTMMAEMKNHPSDVRSIPLIPENHTCNILLAKFGDFASHNVYAGMIFALTLCCQRDAIMNPLGMV